MNNFGFWSLCLFAASGVSALAQQTEQEDVFTPWCVAPSANDAERFSVEYPRSEAELSLVLQNATALGKRIGVAGAGHSQSPTVVDAGNGQTRDNTVLLSLKRYEPPIGSGWEKVYWSRCL